MAQSIAKASETNDAGDDGESCDSERAESPEDISPQRYQRQQA
jgi:hypothetical protein